MTEDQLEQEALSWLAEVGYTVAHGPIARLNPAVPAAAREDALKQVLDLGVPALLAANRSFHRLLVGGVPVEYQQDGETRGTSCGCWIGTAADRATTGSGESWS